MRKLEVNVTVLQQKEVVLVKARLGKANGTPVDAKDPLIKGWSVELPARSI